MASGAEGTVALFLVGFYVVCGILILLNYKTVQRYLTKRCSTILEHFHRSDVDEKKSLRSCAKVSTLSPSKNLSAFIGISPEELLSSYLTLKEFEDYPQDTNPVTSLYLVERYNKPGDHSAKTVLVWKAIDEQSIDGEQSSSCKKNRSDKSREKKQDSKIREAKNKKATQGRSPRPKKTSKAHAKRNITDAKKQSRGMPLFGDWIKYFRWKKSSVYELEDDEKERERKRIRDRLRKNEFDMYDPTNNKENLACWGYYDSVKFYESAWSVYYSS